MGTKTLKRILKKDGKLYQSSSFWTSIRYLIKIERAIGALDSNAASKYYTKLANPLV